MSSDPHLRAPATSPSGKGWVAFAHLVGASLLISNGIVFPLAGRDMSELAMIIGAGALGVGEALKTDLGLRGYGRGR